jgi:hypothetical protein
VSLGELDAEAKPKETGEKSESSIMHAFVFDTVVVFGVGRA